jgi:hypothetical protein
MSTYYRVENVVYISILQFLTIVLLQSLKIAI